MPAASPVSVRVLISGETVATVVNVMPPSVDRWTSWLNAVDICGVHASWTEVVPAAVADRPVGAAGAGTSGMSIGAGAQGANVTPPPAAPVGLTPCPLLPLAHTAWPVPGPSPLGPEGSPHQSPTAVIDPS